MKAARWFLIVSAVLILIGIALLFFADVTFDIALLNVYYVIPLGHLVILGAVLLFLFPGIFYAVVQRIFQPQPHWLPVTHFFLSSFSALGMIASLVMILTDDTLMGGNRAVQISAVNALIGYLLMFGYFGKVVWEVLREKNRD